MPQIEQRPADQQPQSIALLCVGNKLMLDDGIGPAVYEELVNRYEIPDKVELYDIGCLSMDMLFVVDKIAGAIDKAFRATYKPGKEAEATRVVAMGGDGGTTDIGFGCLSGMFERNDDVLYICYDNEAYMNTGVQRSSATPPAARTATTQIAGDEPGNQWGQGKDVPLIAMAHGIPYVATATVADLRDLERKVTKAMSMHGARYIHILVPCPLGWGAASGQTIHLARLAQQTGLFPVFEAEYGEVTHVSHIRRQEPVESYLKLQKRFAHLFGKKADPEVLARIQAMADRNIEKFGLLAADEDEGTIPVAIQADERSHKI